MELNGRRALVTGGGSGIGRATARALTEAGAAVTVLGRTEANLHACVADGDAAHFVVCDVLDADAFRAALADPLDILVNNAGGTATAPLAKLGRAAWDDTLALNLTAPYEACRAVLPGMLARGFGRIVNVASTAGLVGYPYVSAYVAAKHGLVGFTRALAKEVARGGVTVNAVCPGFTDTGLVDRSAAAVAVKTERDPAEIKSAYAATNPQARLVRPEEVAAAIRFLCTAAAINGAAMPIAGGEV